MSDAKQEVLARIRSALGPSPDVPEVPRDYRGVGGLELSGAALLDLFVERVEDYRASVVRVAPDGVAAAVAVAIGEAVSVIVPPGLPGEWVAGVDGVVTDEGEDAQALDTFDAVITAAAVGAAETGTIVLDGSPDQGRRAITLVPDVHICIVRADQVVPDVPDAVAALDPTRPLTWISGPSATSDIELDRVEGVHGPRTLVVVLVENDVD